MAKRIKRSDYRLPPGPRGDAPGGVSTPSNPKGNRTGDMRYGYNSQRQPQLTAQGRQKRAARQRYLRGQRTAPWRRESYDRI